MAAKIERVISRVVPLAARDVDTDQIVPARFLKVTDKNGLKEILFIDWKQDPDFILNQPEVAGADVLLAGDNFGCGSSREHAPWALNAWGFRAVISTSFADIFRNNALKNGIVPVIVPESVHQKLFAAREANADFEVTVDVASQTLSAEGIEPVEFPIDPFAKHRLLHGVDELEYLLGFDDPITQFENQRDA